MILIAPGVYLRRGALPRAPDQVQVLSHDADLGGPLRNQVLREFTRRARSLAR